MRISKWLALSTAMAVVACSGSNGRDGTNGANAPTTGTITGTVTDATAHDALAGVTVEVKTTDGNVLQSATTDASGKYSVTAPIGTVAVGFAKTDYTSPADLLVGVVGGGSVTANAALSEAASGKPSVSLAGGTDVGYGATVTVTAAASDPNGDTLTYGWSNATVPTLGTVTGNGATASVTLPTIAQAFAPRDENPTPSSQYVAGYDIAAGRFGVLPILPDTRGEMSVKVTVSDGRGQSASASLTLDAASILTGAADVPVGTRVYLNSGHGAASAWTLTVPTGSGSAAALDDATSRTPSFLADKKGAYTVAEGTHTMTVYVGDWQGAIVGGSGNTVTPDSLCTSCHDDTLVPLVAPDKFTPWLQTGHATKFTRGINGAFGSSYGAACIGCHTVGFDKGVANNGFDDAAAAAAWSPPAPAPGNWDALVAAAGTAGSPLAKVVRLSNIQCENCHGPNDSAAHKKTAFQPWTSPRVRYSAEVCGTCHASGTGHHIYSEWSQLDPNTGFGHSNRAGSRSIATGSGTLSNHCGRCHSSQGYGEYADQLSAGNPGTLATTAGVTSDNVEPVTCSACHDPHDATNPNQLRFYGDTPLLPGGFAMSGVGKGALCMTCHNSRNGVISGTTNTYLHEDSETYNGGNPTTYSAPHQACQSDVFSGHNAYFLGTSTPMTSRHAAVENTCVGCHMENNPQTHLSHGSPAVSGHVFFVTDEGRQALCAHCHGTSVDGEGIAGQVEAGLASLAAKIGNAVMAKMNGSANGVTVVAYDPSTDLYSATSGFKIDTSATTGNPVTAVGVEEIHGQIGFMLTFTNPVSVQFVDSTGAPAGSPKDMTTFGVQMGSLKDGAASPQALFALSGNMVRAGWNYFLVEGDQSKGIHNPTFVNTVLDQTLGKDLSN